MSSSPFSVVLPVYHGDRADHLLAAIRSVIDQQTRPPDEVVLVRDGPVGEELSRLLDRTRSEYRDRVTWVPLEVNRGLAVALTHGLDAAGHDLIARMDADDLSREDRFELQIPLMDRHDIVGSALHEFVIADGGALKILGKRTPPLTGPEIARYLPFHDPFNHPTVVLRRDTVRAAGGYQPFGTMEDYWLFARMLRAGATAMNLEEALVRYRVDSGSYARRGGRAALATELRLQAELRRIGVTTRWERTRNTVVRGGYRLVPESLRRQLYRRIIARGYLDEN